jgi:hypothetical protein
VLKQGLSSIGSWGSLIQSSQKASIDASQKMSKPLMFYKRKNKDKWESKACVDVGFLKRGLLKPNSSLATRGEPGLSHSSSVLDRVLGEEMDEDPGSVPPFSPLEWSLLCSKVGFSTKGQEEMIVAFLSALDKEHYREDKIVGFEY